MYSCSILSLSLVFRFDFSFRMFLIPTPSPPHFQSRKKVSLRKGRKKRGKFQYFWLQKCRERTRDRKEKRPPKRERESINSLFQIKLIKQNKKKGQICKRTTLALSNFSSNERIRSTNDQPRTCPKWNFGNGGVSGVFFLLSFSNV